LTVGLSFIRRVDSGEADPVLLAVAVEQGDRVAVGDAHDLGLEDITQAVRHRGMKRSNGTKRMAVFSWSSVNVR
jgi:hypothetical protein